MRQLTIDRNKWVRGGKASLGDSQLLNREGRMCCLGFYTHRLKGVPKREMLGQGLPRHVSPQLDEDWHNDAVNINDHRMICSTTRERRLTKLFAKQGIRLRFVG